MKKASHNLLFDTPVIPSKSEQYLRLTYYLITEICISNIWVAISLQLTDLLNLFLRSTPQSVFNSF